ncbi:Methyl-accepting chemotaxis protein [Catenovulum agarivorans DS-2]|uniref:Methyl-accepting chemotaxis protein n=1 Tax=Catenovulum agarivorans DS-2 TaxID=1328313 RepID=W7QP23_9ALTE|nr:methyl-accepting chemotaxis protein [Catenovulum agarivorans]EWH10717.1 Methyl-accepting chemotaxis protein [Catenovulum agarivorans DS-2]
MAKYTWLTAALIAISSGVTFYFQTWWTLLAPLTCVITVLSIPHLTSNEQNTTSSNNEQNEQLIANINYLEQEISNYKHQLSQASQNEQLYRSVLDLIPDWIYVKDTQHNYLFANRSFMHALPKLEIGASDDKIMPADFCEKIWRDEQHVIKTGQPIKDVEEQAGDTWYSTTKVQWNDAESKQTKGIIGVTRNVTEAVNNRLRVEENAQLIQKKIARVYEIQEDTAKVKQGANDCSGVVDKMTEIIKQINDGNEKIESTVVLIKGLASQSKLLSINAAIEAAKAGDSGRGFGVVAHEVRELAERSEQAVTEIQAAIDASSIVIKSGTGTMHDTNKAFSVSIKQIEGISESLNGLSDELKAI